METLTPVQEEAQSDTDRREFRLLKDARLALRLTQKEVAARLEVQQPVYAKWEGLQQKPTRERVASLAKVLCLMPAQIEAEIQRYFYS